ncbi:MAG: hypothetical protein RIE06_28215 [Roseibium album]|uniref:hypothetical protein n=1 Tax=Roseibium album TaxID=311410 RepID=UPI0032EFAB0D
MVSTPSPSIPEELVERAVSSAGLDAVVARRLLEDVTAYYAESVQDFVVRRHRELAAEGWRNEAIYARLRDEIGGRLFPGPQVSTRQIRRMIYG